ncbi:hypothetical protein SAMN04488030_1310 [Aliiroseovarius halocynthiae]|nr:hypothetical protein [Aliiroseovarius halocynthiae]SMR71967.1 hypothetical protein SAMN04488030_1310 [Aliiroseovarius halocynthiae]
MTTPKDRVQNMTEWLDFLQQNPDSDFESVMELRVPMSAQVEIMRKAEELGVSSLDVVLFALADYGIAKELVA